MPLKRAVWTVAGLLVVGMSTARTVEAQDRSRATEETRQQPAPRWTRQPLSIGTVGGGVNPLNAIGGIAADSLFVNGGLSLGQYIFRETTPFIHDIGGAGYGNTAVGRNALVNALPYIIPSTTYEGSWNSAFGGMALYSLTTGLGNNAFGFKALYKNTEGGLNNVIGLYSMYNNTTGSNNTVLGNAAAFSNTTGSNNTVVGRSVMGSNQDGSSNVVVGSFALSSNTSGDWNTAIGTQTGMNWTTGDFNIGIGKGAYGIAGESFRIRIGGAAYQTHTYIAGIRGATGANTFDEAVCTSSDHQLGPCAESTIRRKTDVRALGDTSELVEALRPVSFRYLKEGVSGERRQVGLIAEEVAELLPGLVSYDDQGQPVTVRYEMLTPILLNELQRLGDEVAELRRLVLESGQSTRR